MPAIRGLTVSVGEWYADILKTTLWAAMRHLTGCLVVTAPGDPSIEVARSVPGVDVFETDLFRRDGDIFNKGAAIEAAFDKIGRDGWILIFDADILMPARLPLWGLDPTRLHGTRRRILDDPSAYSPTLDWKTCPLRDDPGPIGYFQLFHADAPALRDVRPWYGVEFPHAGGGDARFMLRWPAGFRSFLPAECLHLGPVDTNWFGADPEGRELMKKWVAETEWKNLPSISPEPAPEPRPRKPRVPLGTRLSKG
jgi:hypothetical protein